MTETNAREVRHRISRIVVLAALAVGACTSAQPASNAPPTPLPRQPGCTTAATNDSLCIVVLGDSIGQGVPSTGDDRWWVRLRLLLTNALPGRHVTIDNWAVSGSRVDVLESATRDQPEIDTYAIAIIIEGVNDAATTPIEAWQPRYRAAVKELQARGVIPILVTPPPSYEDGGFGTQYDATAGAIRDVAAAGPWPLLDLAAQWRAAGPTIAGAYYVDLIHQSDAGQIVMAALARDVVLEAVPRD